MGRDRAHKWLIPGLRIRAASCKLPTVPVGSVPNISGTHQGYRGTGLDLEQLAAVDRMRIASTLPAARVASTRRRFRSPQDLDLDFNLNS